MKDEKDYFRFLRNVGKVQMPKHKPLELLADTVLDIREIDWSDTKDGLFVQSQATGDMVALYVLTENNGRKNYDVQSRLEKNAYNGWNSIFFHAPSKYNLQKVRDFHKMQEFRNTRDERLQLADNEYHSRTQIGPHQHILQKLSPQGKVKYLNLDSSEKDKEGDFQESFPTYTSQQWGRGGSNLALLLPQDKSIPGLVVPTNPNKQGMQYIQKLRDMYNAVDPGTIRIPR